MSCSAAIEHVLPMDNESKAQTFPSVRMFLQADAPYKSPFQVFDMDESTPKSAGYEKMARPTPEASKNSAIRMIKEARSFFACN